MDLSWKSPHLHCCHNASSNSSSCLNSFFSCLFSHLFDFQVLDYKFELLSSSICGKPVLFLTFLAEKDEIVMGGTGSISFWKVQRKPGYVDFDSDNEARSKKNRLKNDIYLLTEKRTIRLDDEDWVSFVLYEKSQDKLYCAVETSIFVFNYLTGTLIDIFRDSHEMSITCIAYYAPFNYLLTAGKDGKIRIWNYQNALLNEFRDHFGPVTGLILAEKICEGTPIGSMPLVISSSLDGTIRLWNFETRQCLNRYVRNRGSIFLRN